MPSLPNELWWNIIAHAISPRSNLAMVEPSLERLHPFLPGTFSGFGHNHFYASQLGIWKHSNMVARNFVQVNRLWRGIAERFLYSAFFVREEWQVQRFIDTIKMNPNLAKQLRTLVLIPPNSFIVMKSPRFDPLIEQVLSLCHGIVAIVAESYFLSCSLPLLQSPNSSRRLLLLSALDLPSEEFRAFVVNFKNYASLQVLELSCDPTRVHTLPSFPEDITFPSLHTFILGYFDPLIINVVAKWELPSLKELTISQWDRPDSTPLLSLIQRSYERLEFFSASIDLLHDPAFYDIIQAPPSRLRNVTLDFMMSACSLPPMHPAIKLFFGHVVTLGISTHFLIWPQDEPAWVQFFSDPTYMPYLHSVLTDMTGCPLGTLHPFENVLEDRGVAFKGVMDDDSTFVPIKLLKRDTLEVSMFPLVIN